MATKNPTMMAGAEVPATLSGLRQPMAIAMAGAGRSVKPDSMRRALVNGERWWWRRGRAQYCRRSFTGARRRVVEAGWQLKADAGWPSGTDNKSGESRTEVNGGRTLRIFLWDGGLEGRRHALWALGGGTLGGGGGDALPTIG